MCSVSVKRKLNVSAVKATSGDRCTGIAQIRAGIASALAIYIITNFALQTNAYSAKGGVLETSCVAVYAGIVTHVGDIVASKSLSHRIYCILSEILHFITYYARPCRFITT